MAMSTFPCTKYTVLQSVLNFSYSSQTPAMKHEAVKLSDCDYIFSQESHWQEILFLAKDIGRFLWARFDLEMLFFSKPVLKFLNCYYHFQQFTFLKCISSVFPQRSGNAVAYCICAKKQPTGSRETALFTQVCHPFPVGYPPYLALFPLLCNLPSVCRHLPCDLLARQTEM